MGRPYGRPFQHVYLPEAWLLLLLTLWPHNTKALDASLIDDSDPNPMVVGNAFGFMLFGNDGFMKLGIEKLVVDDCMVSYEMDGGFYCHAIQRIHVS